MSICRDKNGFPDSGEEDTMTQLTARKEITSLKTYVVLASFYAEMNVPTTIE
jgi:hypothetical protein